MVRLPEHYVVPIRPEDYKRAEQLAQFLADKHWTIGEAKMAIAAWFEQVGCPPEYPVLTLFNELASFTAAVGELRGYREGLYDAHESK